MATTKGNLLAKQQEQQQVAKANSSYALGLIIQTESVRDRFHKMLGDKAPKFLSSLLTLANQNKNLQRCHPQTVLSSAAIAASLDLPINPSLGFAWIVPYGNTATFQCGYKGLIQLAQRSGMMKTIISTEVYEGEIENWNRFTETFKAGEKKSDKVVGFYAAFELVNGFKKCAYMTTEEMTAHAKRFSKSFNSGPWQTDYTAMGKKTLLAAILRTFAPMSTEMQLAVEADGKTGEVFEDGSINIVDAEMEDLSTDETVDGKAVDVETGEIIEAEEA